MENKQIEGLTESLVREYLSRKGLHATLKILDEEMPRSSSSISNRNSLMDELNLKKIMRANKERDQPFRTMLEVMVDCHVKRNSDHELSSSFNSNSQIFDVSKPTFRTRTHSAKSVSRPSPLEKTNQSKIPSSSDLIIEDNLDSETLLGDGKSGIFNSEKTHIQNNKHSNTINKMLPKHRDLSAAVIGRTEDLSRRRVPKSRPLSSALHFEDNHTTSRTTTASRRHQNIELDGKSPISKINSNADQPALEDSLHISAMTPRKHPSSITDVFENARSKSNDISRNLESVENSNRRYSAELSSMANDLIPKKASVRSNGSTSNKNVMALGDLELGDLDDETDLTDVELASNCIRPRSVVKTLDHIKILPIDTKTAQGLKVLLFGSGLKYFNDEWKYQSFCFGDLPDLQYGIVQKKGGPCGVLAAVQACFLQKLLFSEKKISTNKKINLNRKERSIFLAQTLTKILWRAGDESKAVVALPSTEQHVMATSKFKPDQLTERLMLYNFNTSEDLSTFLEQNIHQFETDSSSGVILLLYSAILSRGILNVKSDFDEPEMKLMAAHGYCTQEMVNLLLTGRAVSNVFNDKMELESGGVVTILNGIKKRSDIGFLSLFEHYKSCQVGTYYKTPKYPIWVVCSESHFSVLFSRKKELTADWKAERWFDLFYYDGLSRQECEIKLTIDTTNPSFKAPSDEDLVPPLEHCIRTKWPDAEVDWNGYEPIL